MSKKEQIKMFVKNKLKVGCSGKALMVNALNVEGSFFEVHA